MGQQIIGIYHSTFPIVNIQNNKIIDLYYPWDFGLYLLPAVKKKNDSNYNKQKKKVQAKAKKFVSASGTNQLDCY